MTANELEREFNDEFRLNPYSSIVPRPKTYEVDHETYANCCQEVFNWLVSRGHKEISLGPQNNGLMFKNVELILKEN